METMVRPPRTGLEAFEMLPEGTLCQLINDAIIVYPTPGLTHANVRMFIGDALFTFVQSERLGEVFFVPVDVYLDDKNVFQPDIIFLSTARLQILKNRGVFGPPDLIIEILSENRKLDLVTKKRVYETAGIKEYWVVDPLTKWCEGFQLNDGRYQSMGEATGTMILQLLSLTINF